MNNDNLTITMRGSLRAAFAASERYEGATEDATPEYRFTHWDVDGNQLRALGRRGLVQREEGGYHSFTTAGLDALVRSEQTLQADKFEEAAAEQSSYERKWKEQDARNHKSLQQMVDRREGNLDRELRKAQQAVWDAEERIARFNRRYPAHELLGVGTD